MGINGLRTLILGLGLSVLVTLVGCGGAGTADSGGGGGGGSAALTFKIRGVEEPDTPVLGAQVYLANVQPHPTKAGYFYVTKFAAAGASADGTYSFGTVGGYNSLMIAAPVGYYRGLVKVLNLQTGFNEVWQMPVDVNGNLITDAGGWDGTQFAVVPLVSGQADLGTVYVYEYPGGSIPPHPDHP